LPMKRHSQKKSPMTAASDELLLLQSQLLAKEEEAKMKEKRLSRALKEKLAREEQNNTLNLHKTQTQWQRLLHMAEDEELRQDITGLSQTFAHEMECKDKVIKVRAQGWWEDTTPGPVRHLSPNLSQLLVTDLEQAEEQHAQALRGHVDKVDRLLELQRCRLALLEEAYGAQLLVLEEEFESERYGKGEG
ncbi:DRC2 protein, partial [Piaya cayana]|nr:DRC2 protein [Piaya cayana]